MPDVKAVVDIGTNSVKFLLGEASAAGGGAFKILRDTNEVARLGEGLRAAGEIAPQVAARNVAAVSKFVDEARAAGASEIVAVGTMALRTAANAQDFARILKEATGVTLRVLSGEEEARLSYIAALSGISVVGRDVVTFDTGGGSTEFVHGRGCEIERAFSVDIGAVRLTENFFAADPIAAGSLDAAAEMVWRDLSEGGLPGLSGRVDFLVGMGGTLTALSAIRLGLATYDADLVQGSTLTYEGICAQIEIFARMTTDERKKIVGLPPKRADVILAGTCIVRGVMEILNASSLTVSDRGLRHALLYEMMKK